MIAFVSSSRVRRVEGVLGTTCRICGGRYRIDLMTIDAVLLSSMSVLNIRRTILILHVRFSRYDY